MGITLFTPPSLPVDEAARAAAVRRSGALDATHDPVIQQALEDVRARLGTNRAAVSIIYEDWQYLIATAGLPTGPYSRRLSFCGHAILEPDGIFCVTDTARDHRFAEHPDVLASPGIRFYAGAPILFEDQPLGVLCVFDPAPRAAVAPTDQVYLAQAADRIVARLSALAAERAEQAER